MAFNSIGTRTTDIYQKHESESVDSFIIVWLDAAFKRKDYGAKMIETLLVVVNDVKVFANADACIDYITDLKNERILLIVSNSIDRCVLTFAQDLPAVLTLYILCASEEEAIYERLSKLIPKVKGIDADITKLIEQIKIDIYRTEHGLIGFEVLDTTNISLPILKNRNKQEYSFMHSQLLRDVFLKFQDNSISELAEYCRTIYADNLSQLAMIDVFERDYEPNKAILWYTKDSFLYKMVNKALRTQHIETLYHMRTFIRHLHQQLTQLCPINGETHFTPILTLYRGQRMSMDEFEKLKKNEGGLLSVSNFLSTSASQELALIYAGESSTETIAIVFELTIELNEKTNSVFACIEKFSHYGEDEHEWLFSMGSVFRIEKIELIDNIWYTHLTLTNDQDETLEKLTVHMSKIIQIQHNNPLIPLCRLFARMGEYKKAVELCEKNVESENGWEIKATLYDTLALMHSDEGDEGLALSYHQQALDIVAEHVDPNDLLLASYHNNVAISCSRVDQDERAIKHYRMAIDLELRAPQPDYTNIAYSYESMGVILQYNFDKYDEAMNCYEHALELMLVHLPSTHSDLFSLYDSMATVYETQNEMDKALDVLYKCLDGKQNSVDCNPHDLAHTYRHIARIYKQQNELEKASEMLNKCREIEISCPPSNDLKLNDFQLYALYDKLTQPNNTL